MRGRGTVGPMKLHRAAFNRQLDRMKELIESKDSDVNEVDGAGVTPLMCAAYEGWVDGVAFLISNGAKVNASNNAGDTAYIWAEQIGNDDVCEVLKKNGANPTYFGQVIVPEHIPKVRDFYDSEEGQKHPKPSEEYLSYQRECDAQLQNATDEAIMI
jgi:ankyrin repeat protein